MVELQIPTVNEIFSYLFSDHEGRIPAMLTQDSDQIRWSEKIRGVLQNVFQDLEKNPEKSCLRIYNTELTLDFLF